MKVLTQFALLSVLFVAAACAQSPELDSEREERILANLRYEFPQLQEMTLVIRELEPSGIDGLERGLLVIEGQQEQPFLIGADDTQLYLIAAEPIDASRTPEELASAEQERLREAAQAAESRGEELYQALSHLPARGNPDAPVTIIEFSDFQCPYCARAHSTVQRLLANNPDTIRLIYAHYPLPNHQWARPAALASHCAAEQDGEAFWLLHDRYFDHQREMTAQNVIDRSRTWLEGTGVDMNQWNTCVTDESSEAHQSAQAEIELHLDLANQHGVRGTPAFFINGAFLSGAQPLEIFQAHVDAAAE